MKTKRGCLITSGLLLLFACLVLLAIIAIWFFQKGRIQTHTEPATPIVIIKEPAPGTTFAVGTPISISAIAFGKTPIMRVELWLDNNLQDTQQTPNPNGMSTFPVNFNLLMPSDGSHIIYVRAMDAQGVFGQSLPIGLLGITKDTSGTVLVGVTVQEGQTLEDIANANGSDTATLQTLNPSLGNQQPPPGTKIQVPLAPEQPEPEATKPQNPPPNVIKPNTPMLTLLEPSPLKIDLGKFMPISLPLAPQGLAGEVDNCYVTLKWDDLAENESRYEVWTAWMGISPQLVAELSPSPTKGIAWYRFRSPQTGWIPFWVEAVNAKGKQPSNTVTLFVDPQKCEWSQGSGQYLMVQVFEMTVKDNSDRVYCYVSYENNPEQRIPAQSNEFIQVKGSKANFTGTAIGNMVNGPNSILIPTPQDGVLDVSGKCLGWAGNNLHDMGAFSASFATTDWDGARHTIQGASYSVEFAIKPWTPAVESAMLGKFWYEDPTLSAPWGLTIHNLYSAQGNIDPRERRLRWNWDGDPTRITGFQVFLEGKPYGYFKGADTRSADVMNEYYCGHTAHWQVAAVSGEAQSPPSTTAEEMLTACHTFVVVQFNNVTWIDTKDGFKPWAQWQPCDSLDVYYSLGLNGVKKSFGWSPSFGQGCVNCLQSLACGTHSLLDMGLFYQSQDTHPDILVTAVDTPDIPIGIWADFWDADMGGFDDHISYHVENIYYPSLQQAQADLGCGKDFQSTDKVHDAAGVSFLSYRLTVYPNACNDIPVGIPLPIPPWW